MLTQMMNLAKPQSSVRVFDGFCVLIHISENIHKLSQLHAQNVFYYLLTRSSEQVSAQATDTHF